MNTTVLEDKARQLYFIGISLNETISFLHLFAVKVSSDERFLRLGLYIYNTINNNIIDL